MSSDRQRPVASLTCKIGQQNYSILSIWRGGFPGAYSISRDKGSEKYPSIGDFKAFLTACASCWNGEGFLNLSIESEREQRGSGGQRDYDRPRGTGAGPGDAGYGGVPDDFSGNGGGGDFGDIPFMYASKGIAQ
jgi:hypothetical protein